MGFEIENGVLKKYIKEKGETRAVIPAGVTAIEKDAFYECKKLTEIIIPDGVVSIGDWAFYCCTGLTRISIPDSVSAIGKYAFDECRRLTEVILPDGLTSISEGLFFECKNLSQITVPKSVKTIGDRAFGGCGALAEIPFSEGVEEIGESAFISCMGLTQITLPDSVTTLKDSAFYNCQSLAGAFIPAGVSSMGYNIFSKCPKLTDIVVSENNESFSCADGVLFNRDKTKLLEYINGAERKEYTVPDGVQCIGEKAFAENQTLTRIFMPDSVTEIEARAFLRCQALRSINISNGVKVIEESTFMECTRLKKITVPEGAVFIGESAFSLCGELEEAVIPSTVKMIKMLAFYRCYKLAHIDISTENKHYICEDGVLFNRDKTAIVEYLSSNTRKAYTVPDSVKTVAKRAFFGCDSLTQITLTDNITSIEEEFVIPFREVKNLFLKRDSISVGIKRSDNCEIRLFCDFNAAKGDTELRESLFKSFSDSELKLRLAVFAFFTGSKEAFIKEYVRKKAVRAVELMTDDGNAEMVSRLLETGFVTKKNIDSLIDRAIARAQEGGSLEIQVMLTNYKFSVSPA